MPNEKPAIMYVLLSRKFWSAVVGFAAILYMAWVNDEALDPDTIVNAILGIVAAYMASVAFEDGMSKQAEAKATTTTVSTPGTSAVTTTPADTPAQPFIDTHGLR